MDKEQFEKVITGMKDKIGEENYSLISDDLGVLITDNAQTNSERKALKDKISKLEDKTEMLVETNGNLLKQVHDSIAEDDRSIRNKKSDNNETEKITIDQIYDQYGNFI